MTRKEIRAELKKRGYIGSVRKIAIGSSEHGGQDSWSIKRITDGEVLMTGQLEKNMWWHLDRIEKLVLDI